MRTFATIPTVDTVSLVVSAVALGASAGFEATATAAVKDAYAGLKQLITDRFGTVDVAPVEAEPESERRRAALEDDLRAAGGGDAELAAAARRVLDAVGTRAPETAAALGIDVQRVRAAFLEVEHVEAAGTGVRVSDSEFSGGIAARDVRAGPPGDAAPSRR